jgi:hypothetical protein
LHRQLQIIHTGAENPPVAWEYMDRFLTDVIALFIDASTFSGVTNIVF